MSPATSWADAQLDAAHASAFGFDSIATGDHLRHPDDTPLPVIDGWSVLAAWAATTDRLRLGMLVANMVYRHPVVLAHQAVAVDVISGGRLTLGIGSGIYAVDHTMAGMPPWPPPERVARLAEFVEALTRVLAGSPSFAGRYYRFDDAVMTPAVQRPRPPIIVAALGPGALRVAAQHGDGWNTFGGRGLDAGAVLDAARRQAAILDRHCEELGRDPATLTRSLLAVPPVAPWRSVDAFPRLVDRARELGFDELVVFAPRPDEVKMFERVCPAVLACETDP